MQKYAMLDMEELNNAAKESAANPDGEQKKVLAKVNPAFLERADKIPGKVSRQFDKNPQQLLKVGSDNFNKLPVVDKARIFFL